MMEALYPIPINLNSWILLINSLIAAIVLVFSMFTLSISLLLTMVFLGSSQAESTITVLTIAVLIPTGLIVIFSLKIIHRIYDRLCRILPKQSLNTKDHSRHRYITTITTLDTRG
jgi:hypothetical protein